MDIRIIRIAILAIAISFAAGAPQNTYAQSYENTPVSISKEKVKVNGTICYSHIVLERQTLFSISKAYNVSLDDIYRFNPNLKEEGLKKNSIILIPAEGTKPAEEAPAVLAQTEEPAQVAAEPIAAKEEQQEEKAEPAAEKKVEVKEQKIHVVKWFESLTDIAARYGITVDELVAANDLAGKKIKSRMRLIIPAPGEYASANTEEAETEEEKAEETVTEESVKETEEEKPWWHSFRRDKVTASVLLPLKATGTSSSWSNMDFYSGVLLAVKDLAQNGISTDLKVHDIADGKLEAGINATENSDIIIGPVSAKDLKSLSAMAPSSMIVSPLDPKAESLVAGKDGMIQAPTPHKAQYNDLAAWIKEDNKAEDKVLLISEKGVRQSEAIMEMKNSVDSTGITYDVFSYSILEGRDVMEPLKSLMTLNGVNRVLIASESEAFVNDVVRNLGLMIHQKYNVILYAPSKIRSFETIEVENFHKVNMHVSLSYYIDYEDPRVKNFLMTYRALFNAEPSQFAFQGYDIATYFISLCSKYGNRWPEMMEQESRSMLQSTFAYQKAAEGGYINQGLRRIVYENNWKVTKVR